MAPGTANNNTAVVSAITVRTSGITATISPAIVGPRKKPACMEKVSQPIERPRRLAGTHSGTALHSEARVAPAPKPPALLHTHRGEADVVVGVGRRETAARMQG